MSSALERLTSAAFVLEQDALALELAVRAMYEACGRGLAFGLTTRGPHAERVGVLRMMHAGQVLAPEMPHLAHVRTPAYDIANVPVAQRNRWVEPFREGIATHEGFKASTLYPMVRRFGVLEQGRVAVCAAAKQVALVGVAIPEGTEFSDDERARLVETGAALVVPLHIAAVVADQMTERSALERLFEGAKDALVATDAAGTVLATTRPAIELLRGDRGLAAQIASAVRVAEGHTGRLAVAGRTLHVSPHVHGEVACLVAIDADVYPEPPIVLSPRQEELLVLVEKGLGNAEIAAAMSLAAPTVKTMLERLYRKVGVAGRGELASWARQRGRAP